MENEIEIISNANNLVEAFRLTKKGSIWKESVQKYEINLLRNTYYLRKEIRDGTYQQKDFFEFVLNERGKTRYIKSMHISDRVVQRSLCDNILIPKLRQYLIYDNGASLKNKGVDFTRKRLECHLHKFYRTHHSNDGYILLIDYSKFFDNIRHDILFEFLETKFQSKEFLDFVKKLISSFSIDVSYLSDKEYESCLHTLFNSLEYMKLDRKNLNKEKMMDKSLGIGSQISQIFGIFFPTKIDNYCKIVKGMKYYGRYMDDAYIIHESKDVLKELLKEIDSLSQELGLFINYKKTQIVKLSHGFTFLKTKYNLTATGKIIKRMSPKSITKERQRLKKYKHLLLEGKMTYDDIASAYRSWRGNAMHFFSYRSIKNLDQLYNQLFIDYF